MKLSHCGCGVLQIRYQLGGTCHDGQALFSQWLNFSKSCPSNELPGILLGPPGWEGEEWEKGRREGKRRREEKKKIFK